MRILFFTIPAGQLCCQRHRLHAQYNYYHYIASGKTVSYELSDDQGESPSLLMHTETYRPTHVNSSCRDVGCFEWFSTSLSYWIVPPHFSPGKRGLGTLSLEPMVLATSNYGISYRVVGVVVAMRGLGIYCS